MAQAGDKFHKLVTKIERIASDNPNITIKSHQYITDKKTRKPREHDIILSYDDNHRSFLIAIECKDWKKRVDSPTIEAFVTKLNDTGINKGIIVSSNGFSTGALEKAKGHSIECWSLQEAEGFDWCQTPGITQCTNLLTYGYLGIIPKEPCIEKMTLFRKTNNTDIAIEKEGNLKNFILNIFNKVKKPESEKEIEIQIVVSNTSDFYILTDSKKKLEIDKLILTARYKTVEDFLPFSFHTYKDATSDNEKMQIASAHIPTGQMSGDVIIKYGKDGGEIFFVKE